MGMVGEGENGWISGVWRVELGKLIKVAANVSLIGGSAWAKR